MARRLTSYVHVHQDDGTSIAYGPDDTVPAGDAAKITNPKAWEGEDDKPKPVKSSPARPASQS